MHFVLGGAVNGGRYYGTPSCRRERRSGRRRSRPAASKYVRRSIRRDVGQVARHQRHRSLDRDAEPCQLRRDATKSRICLVEQQALHRRRKGSGTSWMTNRPSRLVLMNGSPRTAKATRRPMRQRRASHPSRRSWRIRAPDYDLTPDFVDAHEKRDLAFSLQRTDSHLRSVGGATSSRVGSDDAAPLGFIRCTVNCVCPGF